ncbi:MAG: D-alanine--(R)-lactate ligase, partial [Acetatifactor sp.]|nr:D-alanine--(R)-lactate ligase [Acetatifactor sp.]
MKNVKDVKNILVIFGGVSSEYEVSLESAYAVLCNLDKEKYRPLPLGISRQGQWFYFMGDFSKIKEDTWCNGTDCVSAVLSPDRTAHELLLLKEERVERISVDVAFPVLHGRFGEDGTVQGLVELAGIPLAGCAALASALCMDKDRAHKLAACFGVRVPKATVLAKDGALEAAKMFASQVGYPLFAKPVKAGSSYGVTKVEAESQLAPAIALAFKYDDRVILEEAIGGFEVGCAVLGTDRLIV